MGTPPSHHSQEPPMMAPHFQNQPGFQHIRHITPSASPPIPNGAFQHVQRQHTPQPYLGSRPSSRNAPRRQSSNLGPQHMSQPPPVNGYAYMPQPTIYTPQTAPMMPQHAHPPMQQPPPSFQYPGPPPQHQLQQVYMEEQRRSPAFPQERHTPGPSATPPQPQQLQLPQQMPPQTHEEHQQAQQHNQQMMLEPPVKRLSVKSRSIFTPIDESRSILSQHWASSTSAAETLKSEPAAMNRSHSVDVSAVAQNNGPALPSPPPPPSAQNHDKNRAVSTSSAADTFAPPPRTNNAQLGAKRPRLKVQIPDEPSDGGGSATADSSPRGSTETGSHPSRRGDQGSQSSGVVLPPPSPSASALLSAGATGPPNPFARPHPPSQASQANGDRDRDRSESKMETPVSALPSRFMNNEFLPSPSSFFYPEWNMRGGDSNTLPSPLNFATPVVGFGASFLREDSSGAGAGGAPNAATGTTKRKTPDEEEEQETSGIGEAKRLKIES